MGDRRDRSLRHHRSHHDRHGRSCDEKDGASLLDKMTFMNDKKKEEERERRLKKCSFLDLDSKQ